MPHTIIKRVGGKIKMREWIKSHLPSHSIYCEPFGGSFAVGFSMPKPNGSSYRLVYNDLDNHVYNLFSVLRNNKMSLIDAISFTPYSRKEFDHANEYINNKKYLHDNDSIEWARNYIIFNRQSMFGKEDGTWCVSRKGENSPLTWMNLPALIHDSAEFLKHVFIENLDYKNCIKKWDTNETCFYIDPPYEKVEKNFYHVNKQSGFNHEDLFELVCSLHGNCAISYYDSKYIRDMYKTSLGFRIYEKRVFKHMQKLAVKDEATEILIVKGDVLFNKENIL